MADQQAEAHLTSGMRERADHGEDSYRGHGRLQDMVTVVTGGDSGIGRAVALAFAREGADVVIGYLTGEDEDAAQTARLVEEARRRIVLVPGDLTAEAACLGLVDRAVEEFGRIDVLVNNAAYQLAQPRGIADITTEQLDRTMKTNLYAMFWLCKAALPHMPPGSSIINTSSVLASTPSPELLDYATTKAGIAGFTRALAQSASERGVRVNSVAPGTTWTPLVRATMPEEMVENFGEHSPIGRAAQPAEVATAFVYLASRESSYVTGEVLAVTGGLPVTA
jgi:NAD(P)-dependent dehydrogenase (short-subunit alcohol dehydrogenase family)